MDVDNLKNNEEAELTPEQYSYDQLLVRFKVMNAAAARIQKDLDEARKTIQEYIKLKDDLQAQIVQTNHLTAGRIQANNTQLNEIVEENVRLQSRIDKLERELAVRDELQPLDEETREELNRIASRE